MWVINVSPAGRVDLEAFRASFEAGHVPERGQPRSRIHPEAGPAPEQGPFPGKANFGQNLPRSSDDRSGCITLSVSSLLTGRSLHAASKKTPAAMTVGAVRLTGCSVGYQTLPGLRARAMNSCCTGLRPTRFVPDVPAIPISAHQRLRGGQHSFRSTSRASPRLSMHSDRGTTPEWS